MDFLQTLQQSCRPDHLRLDIGANLGGYTYLMRQHGPGVILAFEPVPSLAEQVRVRFADDPDIQVIPCGVSDRVYTDDGFSILEAWTVAKPEDSRRGFSLGALAEAGLTADDRFSVHFTTVDAAVQTWAGTLAPPTPFPVVDFLKIDVDGYEFRVLRGATQTLLRDRPPILIEIGYLIGDLGDSIPDMLAYIYTTLEYRLLLQDGTRLALADWTRWYPHGTTFDVAMVPAEWAGELIG